MPKPTPNPPGSQTESTNASCASNLHLKPAILKTCAPHKPSTVFVIAPDIDTESLLAHACESLASASVMASDFATFVEGPQRSMVLGIQQVIMLADLAVNRALDNLDPQG
ncbi:DUF6124 family protein [Pseudomonas fluorescens]|uniref:DUF3077 domain-containing protein n=1 Tax=Pseudomonas fluorescens TaxID=294 RepID=A0A5E7DJD9_PSEFL|nr:DUF6124 family protein [Pseudomonas fluorescens]VVO17700.1 hypothetical protein PS833_03945 [Pseudomonas fluorescens]VVQ02698.1 hypothetical protein PS914_04219 [Pseudomonas fluorescens]